MVKVADFGLAKALESVATLTGGLGTFQWMAPEVLARQHYSQKADVYECPPGQCMGLSLAVNRVWMCMRIGAIQPGTSQAATLQTLVHVDVKFDLILGAAAAAC